MNQLVVKVLLHKYLPVYEGAVRRSYDALKSMASAPFWTAAAELRHAREHAFHQELQFRPSSCVRLDLIEQPDASGECRDEFSGCRR
jgi:hypothetical protein